MRVFADSPGLSVALTPSLQGPVLHCSVSTLHDGGNPTCRLILLTTDSSSELTFTRSSLSTMRLSSVPTRSSGMLNLWFSLSGALCLQCTLGFVPANPQSDLHPVGQALHIDAAVSSDTACENGQEDVDAGAYALICCRVFQASSLLPVSGRLTSQCMAPGTPCRRCYLAHAAALPTS